MEMKASRMAGWLSAGVLAVSLAVVPLSSAEARMGGGGGGGMHGGFGGGGFGGGGFTRRRLAAAVDPWRRRWRLGRRR